jgi:hypothetical protein
VPSFISWSWSLTSIWYVLSRVTRYTLAARIANAYPTWIVEISLFYSLFISRTGTGEDLHSSVVHIRMTWTAAPSCVHQWISPGRNHLHQGPRSLVTYANVNKKGRSTCQASG